MADTYHIFRDPIHGFIKVDDLERDIINSAPFQRLRHIRQLGLCSFVYHGADHTRFAHSLGVMEVATRVFDSLYARDGKTIARKLKWSKAGSRRARNKLRLAALMHDLGHPPFSHAAETLFPREESHESYTVRIAEHPVVSDAIARFESETSVSPADVVELLGSKPLSGENGLLKQIVKGEVDADRMDYLLRDSLYTGVRYGMFDLDRLIETLCVVEREDGSLEVAVEERGKHAAEGMVLARYFMFTQVYFHEIRRVYDLHLVALISQMLGERRYPREIDEFLQLDDIEVLKYAKDHKRTCPHADRILTRRHYECVGRTAEHTEGKDVSDFLERLNRLRGRWPDHILDDISDKAPYPYDYGAKDELKLKLKTNVVVPFSKESKLVRSLERIHQRRVYADPDIAEEAEALFLEKS